MIRDGERPYEDILMYLPRRSVQEFAKGRMIYDAQYPATALYVVILGRVKISTTSDDGGQTVSRIVRTEGLFGESSLITPSRCGESAMALDNGTVMSWTRNEVEQQADREPRLGIALAQYFIHQSLELQDRIESMATRNTPERVTLALLQLATNLGSPLPDGYLRIAPPPRYTIAEFVSTSREIVTFQMNRLRRLGLIRYSRKYIDVYAQAMCENLRRQSVDIPYDAAEKIPAYDRAAGD